MNPIERWSSRAVLPPQAASAQASPEAVYESEAATFAEVAEAQSKPALRRREP